MARKYLKSLLWDEIKVATFYYFRGPSQSFTFFTLSVSDDDITYVDGSGFGIFSLGRSKEMINNKDIKISDDSSRSPIEKRKRELLIDVFKNAGRKIGWPD